MNGFQSRPCVTAAHASSVTGEGESWQDLSGFGFGYQCPEVIMAVNEQMRKGGLSSRVLMSRPMLQLTEQLADITPDNLSMTYLCNSPDEAFEGAMKLARGYQPGRTHLVVVGNADFGCMTYGRAMSWSGRYALSGWPLPLKLSYLSFSELDTLPHIVTRDTLAVVVNPLEQCPDLSLLSQEQAGILNRVTSQSDALLVGCELQTFGRCQDGFHSLNCGLVPDILVYGESLGGGVLPIGAYTADRAVNEAVYGGRNLALHGSTTAGNPASCQAALAALKILSHRTRSGTVKQFEDVTALSTSNLQSLLNGSGIRVSSGPACVQMVFESQPAAAIAERLRGEGLMVHVQDSVMRVSAPILMDVQQWQESLRQLISVLKQSVQNGQNTREEAV